MSRRMLWLAGWITVLFLGKLGVKTTGGSWIFEPYVLLDMVVCLIHCLFLDSYDVRSFGSVAEILLQGVTVVVEFLGILNDAKLIDSFVRLSADPCDGAIVVLSLHKGLMAWHQNLDYTFFFLRFFNDDSFILSIVIWNSMLPLISSDWSSSYMICT